MQILVIEDDGDAADSLAMLLTMKGHSVYIALDGPEGIQAATKDRPDVVCIDIGLPEMDGFAVARAIREIGLKPCLIAITGHGGEVVKRQAIEAGFDHFLVKPVYYGELERILVSIRAAIIASRQN